MAAYIPVLTGVQDIRTETEAFLCADEPDAITERIAFLDNLARLGGCEVTFGAEVEYQFVPDPETANVVFAANHDRLYEEVLKKIPGDVFTDWVRKGEVILPDYDYSVILNLYTDTYNNDQSDSDIREVKTYPADAMVALKRYWDTIGAIGAVAAEYGYMGLILSSQINAAVVNVRRPTDDYFTDFHTYDDGGPILAAAQRNLRFVHPLQYDAGLETGLTIHEAFPNKHANTAVHQHRLEFRHPLSGIADPRVDMLAFLSAVTQHMDGTVSQAAMNELRRCRSFEMHNMNYPTAQVIHTFGVWDESTNRFVMPVEMESSAMCQRDEYAVSEFANLYYGSGGGSTLRQDYNIVKKAVSGMRLVQTGPDHGQVEIDPDNPLRSQLQKYMVPSLYMLLDNRLRVTPDAEYDSPELYRQRRSGLVHSPVAHRIFGRAISRLTPADDAVARRQAHIASGMVVHDGEELAGKLPAA